MFEVLLVILLSIRDPVSFNLRVCNSQAVQSVCLCTLLIYTLKIGHMSLFRFPYARGCLCKNGLIVGVEVEGGVLSCPTINL